jgi:hypothetical protein
MRSADGEGFLLSGTVLPDWVDAERLVFSAGNGLPEGSSRTRDLACGKTWHGGRILLIEHSIRAFGRRYVASSGDSSTRA